MRSTSRQKKISVITVAFVIVLAIAAFVCWASFEPQALESVKSVTVTVTHSDGSVRSEQFETTAKLLSDALEDHIDIDGEESEFGFLLKAVDGEYADNAEGVWWVFDVNGVRGEYGADAQPIADGDEFSFYTVTY